MSLKIQAVRHQEFGKPADVLRIEEDELPDPGPGMAIVKMLASPIHPSDFGKILGKYGKLPTLPATAGREAVGEVMALGPGSHRVKVGDRVRFPEANGAWQSATLASSEDLFVLPPELSIEAAAMAFVNPPTAWRILRDAHLEEGAWVVQNAANSAVGISVIQMAHHLGLKTLNLVRREELIEPLRALGGDAFALDTDDYPKQVNELTGGGKVLLGLNSVGGDSAMRMLKALSNGGTMVTFGAMSFEAVRFPTRALIFENKSLTGFWMDQWYRDHSPRRAQVMFDKVFALLRDGIVKLPVEATYRLSDFAKAVQHAAEPRLGKVLFKGDL